MLAFVAARKLSDAQRNAIIGRLAVKEEKRHPQIDLSNLTAWICKRIHLGPFGICGGAVQAQKRAQALVSNQVGEMAEWSKAMVC
jgi:hypothetical protein